MPLVNSEFSDLLEARFREIWDEHDAQAPETIEKFCDIDWVSKPGWLWRLWSRMKGKATS